MKQKKANKERSQQIIFDPEKGPENKISNRKSIKEKS